MFKLVITIFTLVLFSSVTCDPKYTLDDKPKEHEKSFYMEKSIPEIKKLMADNLEFVGNQLKATVKEYKDEGLVVVAHGLEDTWAKVEKEWPRIMCALDQVSTDNKTAISSFAVEMYGWTHIINRISEDRKAKPIIPTNDNESDLFQQMTDMEKKLLGALDYIINKSKEGGNRFLDKFHTMLKSWLEKEFEKLNKEIESLPKEQKANNLKVLLEDYTLLQVAPF